MVNILWRISIVLHAFFGNFSISIFYNRALATKIQIALGISRFSSESEPIMGLCPFYWSVKGIQDRHPLREATADKNCFFVGHRDQGMPKMKTLFGG
jgi:hypothetical protein